MLILETNSQALEKLKHFCDTHCIQGLLVGRRSILSVLGANIDLGGVLMCDRCGDNEPTADIMDRILATRPDLPVFLRVDPVANGNDRQPPLGVYRYTLDRLDSLEEAINQQVFSVTYPRAFVRSLMEISEAALTPQFRGLSVSFSPPYVVRDQLIHGELFTLMPLESTWCRGFLSVQVQAEEFHRAILAGTTSLPRAHADNFRELNNLLGEITNLVWGKFKTRFVDPSVSRPMQSQVPIVVNQMQRYFSFGDNTPQLCLRASLSDPDDPYLPPLVMILRFVFNLDWTPEEYLENEVPLATLVESGELELF